MIMNSIKIVFLLTTLEIGGTEKQFLQTVRRLNREYFDLRVLAFPADGPLKPDIEALHVPCQGLGFSGEKGRRHLLSYLRVLQILWRMIRYLRRERPHILQSYLFWGNIWGSLAAKLAGVPVIITGRRELLKSQHRRFPDQWLQYLSNLWATAIISNSQALKQHCLEQEKYIRAEHIHVIPNGVNLNDYSCSSDPHTVRKQLHIPEKAFVVGLLANLRPVKGARDFLKAASLVLQTFPQTVFLLIGRNREMKQELLSLAETLHIRNALRFTGERQDIVRLLSLLDVQVCSSLQEGLSNAILEGMALEKPIVATNVGGNPELVMHEDTGLLVPPGNPEYLAQAILQLLEDPVLREEFGRAGRSRVERLFGIESIIRQTESLYQHLVWKKELPWQPCNAKKSSM